VFTKGVAVSKAGCILNTRLHGIIFLGILAGRLGTECLHQLPGHAEKAELLVRFSPQPKNFMNWCKDLHDLDFSLSLQVVFKYQNRGHKVASEDTV